jgi:hypothetical protein
MLRYVPYYQRLGSRSFQGGRGSGNDSLSAGSSLDRRYYELCAVTELENALRSGDIWVSGSAHERRIARIDYGTIR